MMILSYKNAIKSQYFGVGHSGQDQRIEPHEIDTEKIFFSGIEQKQNQKSLIKNQNGIIFYLIQHYYKDSIAIILRVLLNNKS